jgi:UDP-N-acetylmuramyl-tripeptide synthetase
MRLKDILKGIVYNSKDDISCLDIGNVTCDSRMAGKGDLFIAVRGHSLNGAHFINEAAKKGARVIIAEEDFEPVNGVSKILVHDTRASLPVIAGNFYGHASKKLKTVGVTGTNGKTTITYILENIINRSGGGTGVIGTINYRLKSRTVPSKNTTPGPIELESMLAEMIEGGLSHAVMEVSSHALDQNRVGGISFDVGIFTNLSGEHLDYHATIENYFRAKVRLFDHLKENGTAILNADDKRVLSLRSSVKSNVITYGVKKEADVKAEDITTSLEGSSLKARTPKGDMAISTRLVGIHNISNILASIAASIALGIDAKSIIDGVAAASSVPGRMERVDAGQPFKVFVDYAHTEDALLNILSLLRKTDANRIITVFGCGGNRDKLKRPLMGRAACRLSDHVVITSDNPRFEEPQAIIKDIEKGVNKEFTNYDIVIDRRKAIERALKLASHGDIVVIAGKGHENYQIVKDKVLNFDDRKIAREVMLNAR